jgi:hypothetical protein
MIQDDYADRFRIAFSALGGAVLVAFGVAVAPAVAVALVAYLTMLLIYNAL